MKLLIDTNVLVYDTIEDSDHHQEAKNIIDEASEIYIPSIVIHEFIWILLRRLGLNPIFVIKKITEYLVEDPRTNYILENPQIINKALIMLKNDKSPPTMVNDYLILATATSLKATLATFDNELRKIAKRRGIDVKP